MNRRDPKAHGLDVELIGNLQQTALSVSIRGIRLDARTLLRHLKASRDESDRFVELGLTDDFMQEVLAGKPLVLGREAAIAHSAAALIAADVADQSIAQGIAGLAETFVMLGLRQVTMAAGACLGLSLGRLAKAGAEARSANAKRAAIASHTENRACKAQVLDWYAANGCNYRSKDAAAAAIIDLKLVPIPFRTVRDWLKVKKLLPK